GTSWAATVDQRLEVDETGVAFAAEDGIVLCYPHPAEGQEVLPQGGPRWPLTRTTGGGYAILLTESERILHFPAGGGERLLAAISDANARRIDFVRDAHGVVTDVLHSGGYRVRVTSDRGLITGFWLVRAELDVMLAEFRYDQARRLTAVVNSSGIPLTFSYDDADRIVRCEDRNGMWYRYDYDAADRCVRAEGAHGHLNYTMEYEPGLTRATTPLGQPTVYPLNERFQGVREIDPLGNTTLREWDEQPRLLSHTAPLGRTPSYRHDDRGNLVAVSYPDGTQSLGEYNEFGRPESITAPDGAVWRREYGPTGTLTAMVDPAGARTTYGYDQMGNLHTVTNATGGVTTYEVNLLGVGVSAAHPPRAPPRSARAQVGGQGPGRGRPRRGEPVGA